MIQLFKNADIVTKFSKINKGHCFYCNLPYGKTFFIEYDGALRACQITKKVIFASTQDENNCGILHPVGYEIRIAGANSNRIFWENLPHIFSSVESFEKFRANNSTYKLPFDCNIVTIDSLLEELGFPIKKGSWGDASVARYFYNKKTNRAELTPVTINALWEDENGWHIDYDENSDIKLYKTEKDCYDDNRMKVVGFDDEEKPVERIFEITTIVKVKATSKESAEIKVNDIISKLK